MYCAKHLASSPVEIFSPATLHVGSVSRMACPRPAFFASARIAVLFMSGEPTMYSRETSADFVPAADPDHDDGDAECDAGRRRLHIRRTRKASFASFPVPPCGSGRPGFKTRMVKITSGQRHTGRAAFYGTVRALTTDRVDPTATGSNRAWKKRRLSGSYVMDSPGTASPERWTRSTTSATYSRWSPV